MYLSYLCCWECQIWKWCFFLGGGVGCDVDRRAGSAGSGGGGGGGGGMVVMHVVVLVLTLCWGNNYTGGYCSGVRGYDVYYYGSWSLWCCVNIG